MTVKHKLKLIPARFRWFYNHILSASDTIYLLQNKLTLMDLRKKYHDEFIALDRQEKSAPDHSKLKGKVELLDELMNM